MNKIVCTAFTLALGLSAGTSWADSNEQYGDWFKGIGENPTSLSNLGATGGVWSGLTGEGVSFAEKRIVLEDVEDAIDFSIRGEEPDTEVMDRVQVTMSGLAGALTSLPTAREMKTAGAQVSLALARESGVLGYYAWVGGDNWKKLGGAVPVEESEFTLIVDVDYSVASEPRIRFMLKGNPDTVLTYDQCEWAQITSTAAQSVRRLSGLKFAGNVKLAGVDGSVRLGIAKVGDVKYPTIAEALKNATEGSTVKVLRPTSENVDMTGKSGVTLADGGNMSGTVTVPADQPVKIAPAVGEFTTPGGTSTGRSGEYTLTTKVSGGVISAENIILPTELEPFKEVAAVQKEGTAVKVTLQTKDSNVAAVSVGGRTLPVTTALKTFLSNKVEAYTAAESSTANLQAALVALGENKLPVWQSYVLGLDPEVATSVPKFEPLAADDRAADSLILKVPAVNPPNDSGYQVVFRLYDNGVATGADYTNPQSIPLPLDGKAHAYTIKPVIISQ